MGQDSEDKPLIIISGPTAVGKTDISIMLAKSTGAQIISADSMQVYRGMDIGTAKVTREEMRSVPHHLIDIFDPHEDFNVCKFVSMAKHIIRDVNSRARLPVITGGTGFYIRALLYDCDFETEDDELHANVRKKYEHILSEKGKEYLFELLKTNDPGSAESIHENNTKRVIRALEYLEVTGRSISSDNKKNREKPSPYNFACFAINMERTLLYERIEERVDRMMEQGLLDEVRHLRSLGLTKENTSMQGIGYRQLLRYLDGECTLGDAVDSIKTDTRHFAKRQLTWFRGMEDVIWIDPGDTQRIYEILREKEIYK